MLRLTGILLLLLAIGAGCGQSSPMTSPEPVNTSNPAPVRSTAPAKIETIPPQEINTIEVVDQTPEPVETLPTLKATHPLTIPVRVQVLRGEELLIDQPIIDEGVYEVIHPTSGKKYYVPRTHDFVVSRLKYFCAIGEDCQIYLSGHRWGWKDSSFQSRCAELGTLVGRSCEIEIAGGRTWSVAQTAPAFGRLCEVEVGDEVVLYTQDEVAHRYLVTYAQELEDNSPEMEQFLQAGDKEAVTLTTCSGTREQILGTTVASKRCVVQAQPTR